MKRLRVKLDCKNALWEQILSYNSTPDDISEVFDEAQPVQIYSVSGVYYGNDLQTVKPGIYIIKQGKSRKKVVKK